MRAESKLFIDSGAIVYVECGSRVDSANANNIVRVSGGTIIYQNCYPYEIIIDSNGDTVPPGTPEEPINPYDTTTVEHPDTLRLNTILCKNIDGSYKEKVIKAPNGSYMPGSKWFIGGTLIEVDSNYHFYYY